ncbi:MAG TPA: single-stranded DNA-binding protein [Pseudogracilibacillus sp.]|nr:single-stranded DNA-binding protein [Pseudogracilibacillus sp.]
MLNRVVLVGRLTRDPDLRYTASGIAVANFNVAVNRPFRNQQGEQEADFINCVVWRKQAENLAHYMKKGSLIGVDGRVQTRSYENQEGNMVYVTEVLAESVQFLEPRGASQQQRGDASMPPNDSYQHQQPPKQAAQPSGEMSDSPFQQDGEQIDISDDDLPF